MSKQKQYIKGYVSKGSKENSYKVLASTSAIDRQGDSIDQSGWDLSNFKNNPVMPWAHDYSALPVGKATSIEITDKGLEVEFEFAPAEGNPMAQQVKVLYDEGYLNAVSVGFIPKERKGNIITKAELLEISFVPVPANQEALRLAYKSLDLSLLPQVKEVAEKGEIADEINAEEMYEMKREKMEEVCDVISAMWKVYFDETTPVESFKTLLTEVIGLLQVVADNDGEDMDDETMKEIVSKNISKDMTVKFMESLKDGRTLSAKTLKNIDTAIESMKAATSVLETLKNDSSSESLDGKAVKDVDGNDEIPVEEDVIPAIEEEIEIDSEEVDTGITLGEEDLKTIRRSLVAKDKTNELALSIVNGYLKNLGIK